MTQVQMKVPYTYLAQQFGRDEYGVKRSQEILEEIENELDIGRYTLGPQVQRFEEAWAEATGAKYAVGVGNGTDAIKLSLRVVGVKGGDRVVTAPISFVATVGAILELGAIPVFSEVDDSFIATPASIFEKLNSEVKAVVPVWWAGWMGSMPMSDETPGPRQWTIPVVADACQAVGAQSNDVQSGAFGRLAAFSLHPLKNVNIWGDGGVITTNDEALYKELLLLRNHGLSDRDTCVTPGYNTRLDTIHAIVGYHALKDLAWVTQRRIDNAIRYDLGLLDVAQIQIPLRDPNVKHVYHLYQFEIIGADVPVEVGLRGDLVRHLNASGIEAKVHYPKPLHLMPGFDFLGYKLGDFPRAERFADTHVSLPIHQYLEDDQIDYTIEVIRDYFSSL